MAALPSGDAVSPTTTSGAVPTLAIDSRCEVGECVLWCDRRHALLWTDIPRGRLWMHIPDTGTTLHWDLPARLGCFALCSDGRLLLGLAKGLFLADPFQVDPMLAASITGTRGGERNTSLALQHVVDVEPERDDTRVNDGRSDRHGNFVFGTKHEGEQGEPGSYYQFSFEHGLRRLALPAPAIPNSICFSHDGRTMYFCDSRNPEILCCEYEPERAAVSGVRKFARTDDEAASPDGSVIDAEGFLWNAQWGSGRIVRYRPDGSIERTITVPAINPSCCAFGGKDFDELYVTTAREDMDADALMRAPHAGGVYRLRLQDVRGVPESRTKTAA
jgi:L-arabinonolactonase